MTLCASRAKALLQKDGFHVVDEYHSSSSQYEIIALTQPSWLLSDAYNKVTIIDAVVREQGSLDRPVRSLLVYSGSTRTGSRIFRWLVFLVITTIIAVSIKKEHISHVLIDNAQERHKHKTSVLIFATAVIVRLIFFFVMMADLGADHLIDQYQDPIKYVRAAEFLFGRADDGLIDLYLVGPGYPFFVGLLTTVSGQTYWPVIIIQILLSAFTCVFIYRIALRLLGNTWIATVSGFLAALSPTSISLTNAIVSETLFFFLLVSAFYLFVGGIVQNRWKPIACAGIVGGLTVMVRSAALLFPFVLILIGLLIPHAERLITRKRIVANSALIALIMLVIPAMWGVRNLIVHDTFTVSSTGLLAAKTYLAAKVKIDGEHRHIRDFKHVRDSLYQVSLVNYERGRYKQDQAESMAMVLSTFKNYPALFIEHYFSMVFYNTTSVSSLQHVQIPGHDESMKTIERFVHGSFYNPAGLAVALLGFVVLLRLNRAGALILILPVLYFPLISGVTFGQGSRLIYPAMITQAILIATALVFLYDAAIAGWHTLKRQTKR